MSLPAREMRPERPKKPRKREPLVYTVEVEPAPEDPKARAKFDAWVDRWVAKRMPRYRPPSLRAFKIAMGSCGGCHYKPPKAALTRALHTHHVKPRAAGGTDEIENILVLCARCHALAHVIQAKRPQWGAERVQWRLFLMAHAKDRP
jgi:5-methylcytosine-specific restriction endonuclease McrA